MNLTIRNVAAFAKLGLTLALTCGAINAAVVVEYRFDGNTNDTSGNGRHASLGGDATYGSGYQGSALSGDGTGDGSAGYAFYDGNLPNLVHFTIELWINVPSYDNNVEYFSLYENHHLLLGDYHSGIFSSYASGLTPVNASTFVSVATPTTNEWHHIAFTYDGSSQDFYLDGVLAGSVPTTDSLETDTFYDNGFTIGGNSDRTFHFLDGKIDNLRLHDVALSVDQLEINIPEPGAAVLLGLGILCTIAARRRV